MRNRRRGSIVGALWWRRFHPLVRVGWASVTGRGGFGVLPGWWLLGVGLLLTQTQRKRRVLYRTTLAVGESVLIRVADRNGVLAERTVEG